MTTAPRSRHDGSRAWPGRVIAAKQGLAGSTALLVRVFFAGLVALAAASSAARLVAEGAPADGDVVLGVAGYLALAAWALWQHRRSGRTALGDLVAVVALVAVAAGTHDATAVVEVLWTALFARAATLERRRALVAAVALWVTAGITDSLTGGDGFAAPSHWLLLLPSVLLIAGFMNRLVDAFARVDRIRRYHEALAAGAPALVAATDETAAGEAVVRTLVGLVADLDGAAVSFWRVDEQELVLLGGFPGGHLVERVSIDALPVHLRPDPARGMLRHVGPAELDHVRDVFTVSPRVSHAVVRLLAGGAADVASGLLVISSGAAIDVERVAALDRLGVEAGLALERVALAAELARREELFRGVVQSSSDVIALLDAETTLRYVSPALSRITGADPAAVLGVPYTDYLHPDDVETVLRHCADLEVGGEPATGVQLRLTDGRGGWCHVEVTVDAQGSDGRLTGFVVVMRDITARRALEDALAHQAFHDALTGLANRTLFTDRVEQAILRAQRSGRRVGVALFDLDDFKAVNDALGHAAGDALLVEVAARLAAFVRATDTPARLGGDEFAVLLDDIADDVEGEAVARRVLEAFARPFRIADRDVVVRTSVGLATGGDGATLEALLRNADVAMYAAKDAGKGRFQLFETAMHDAVLARLELRVDLEGALARRELEVVYQPIVDLASGAVSGMEALLRWNHPERGLLSPDAFIPIAEETGLIVPIGRWVLAEACREVRAWRQSDTDLAEVRVNVNLSARQFRDPDLVDCVVATLAAESLPASALRLEVTETALVEDVAAASDVLAALHDHGVRVAIDDFGTGYSSFGYLRRFLVDEIKIDREFVRLAAAGPEDAALLRAILKVGHTLDLRTVAEGVEEAADLAALQAWGCDQAQGYLLARPMGAGDARDWLAARRSASGATALSA